MREKEEERERGRGRGAARRQAGAVKLIRCGINRNAGGPCRLDLATKYMQIDSCTDPHPAARRVFGEGWGVFNLCQRLAYPLTTLPVVLGLRGDIIIAYAQSLRASSALQVAFLHA